MRREGEGRGGREGGREGGRGRPDERCHVLIIPNSEEDISCLELIDEVDPE